MASRPPRRAVSRLLAALGLLSVVAAVLNPMTRPVAEAMEARQVRVIAGPNFSVWMPPPAQLKEPVPVVIVLHGMGANGELIAQGMIEEAAKRGWLLVAPTFRYGDWRDPRQVAAEDPNLALTLAQILDDLPGQTGLQIRPRAMVFGFSRGSQLAHRFAFLYPERVLGVACLAAGTYTIPFYNDPVNRRSLAFPYGLSGVEEQIGHPIDWNALRQVRFWIGVGGDDNRETDVPRAWDAWLGKTRVDRARNFHSYLLRSGIPARYTVFPTVGHAVSPKMREGAIAFFQGLVLEEDALAQTLS